MTEKISETFRFHLQRRSDGKWKDCSIKIETLEEAQDLAREARKRNGFAIRVVKVTTLREVAPS